MDGILKVKWCKDGRKWGVLPAFPYHVESAKALRDIAKSIIRYSGAKRVRIEIEGSVSYVRDTSRQRTAGR